MIDQSIPIVCDMTDASDTTEERLAEYDRLFSTDLTGRERTDTGIRFRFRARDGLAEEIRDLAAREKACCAFFDFDIGEHDDEITWDATVVDDPIARQILDEYYALPDTLAGSTADLFERFARQGLEIVTNDNGVMRPATAADLGIGASSPGD
ncbi:MAG: hypothetical protein HYX32_09935 [Actinobacteria bacterium]|nr:hypothetical protein [Actinomycetota bacterium]